MPPSAPQQVPRTTSSRTTATTTTTTTTTTSTHTPALPLRTLRLRAVDGSPAQRESRHIQWAEDVVDNEGMGKKSSKVCCIYHKPREVGESSSEDTSDSSSSDSDSEPDNSTARPAGRGRGYRPRRHDEEHHHHQGGEEEGEGSHHDEAHQHPPPRRSRRRPSPNAYEKMPKPSGSGKSGKKRADSGQ